MYVCPLVHPTFCLHSVTKVPIKKICVHHKQIIWNLYTLLTRDHKKQAKFDYWLHHIFCSGVPYHTHGDVYSIQQYVIKLVSNLWQVCGFLWGTLISATNKTERHDITEIFLKVALNTLTLNPPLICQKVQISQVSDQ